MKHIKISIFSLLVILAGSCEFGDTNINPALPADVSAQAIVPAAQAGMAFAIGGEVVRINGLFMQQFRGINAQQFDNYKYLVDAADMDGVWRRMYASALNPLVTIQRKAESENSNHTSGMAKVLIAHSIGTLADMFGDVPYSDAFGGLDGNFFPAYDEQESVYSTVQRLLDEAITELGGEAGSGPGLGSDDLVYGGDTDAWIRAANALKAKYYLHTSKVDAASAYSQAMESLGKGLNANGEDLEFVFGSAPNEANPQYQFTQDRGGNIEIDEFFFNLLVDNEDPRAPELLASDNSGFIKDFNSGTYYTRINSPVVFMTYAESKFIEAEIELMGNNDVPAAEAALQEAISASLEKITGASDMDFVMENGTLAGLSDQEAQLERLITQKYIALYSHGLECWTDFRRTGYPDITPVEGGTNTFNINGEVPRRLPYPQTEIDLNSSNVPITSPDFQNRFWWDK
jgi:hypothetical protein